MNDEKKRILEMVKEGLLNADEALLLLEQLDKERKAHPRRKPARIERACNDCAA